MVIQTSFGNSRY